MILKPDESLVVNVSGASDMISYKTLCQLVMVSSAQSL